MVSVKLSVVGVCLFEFFEEETLPDTDLFHLGTLF